MQELADFAPTEDNPDTSYDLENRSSDYRYYAAIQLPENGDDLVRFSAILTLYADGPTEEPFSKEEGRIVAVQFEQFNKQGPSMRFVFEDMAGGEHRGPVAAWGETVEFDLSVQDGELTSNWLDRTTTVSSMPTVRLALSGDRVIENAFGPAFGFSFSEQSVESLDEEPVEEVWNPFSEPVIAKQVERLTNALAAIKKGNYDRATNLVTGVRDLLAEPLSGD